MCADPADPLARLATVAAQLRASGAIGQADAINRLFDFLLAESLAGRSPREMEVARAVFGKDAGFDTTHDATVRVHIHRLRRKLDEVYADAAGARLTIPRGEYRLAVLPPEGAAARPDDASADPTPAGAAAGTPVAPPGRGRRLRGLAWLCLGIVIGFGVAMGAWGLRQAYRSGDPIAQTAFWRPLATNAHPTLLVVGDYYLFGEAPDKGEITRYVREFSINAREDLDEYLMIHPAALGRYVDVNLQYVPIGAAYAMRDVLPLMDRLMPATRADLPAVVAMSRLEPDAVKNANIVYVGLLNGLGILRAPLFGASGFVVGRSYNDLVDRRTGTHYRASGPQSSGGRAPGRDFAYLASFPGPRGNRILVISGTVDAAVTQAAEIAADKGRLDQIAARAGNAEGFEALFEIRTLGALGLGSRLVVARALKLDGLWRSRAMPLQFPDQSMVPTITVNN